MKVNRTCVCEQEIVEGDIIDTPMGFCYFAGEIVGREDGRTVLAQGIGSGEWYVYHESRCEWVSENDGGYKKE